MLSDFIVFWMQNNARPGFACEWDRAVYEAINATWHDFITCIKSELKETVCRTLNNHPQFRGPVHIPFK
jgi:hypothetical protein